MSHKFMPGQSGNPNGRPPGPKLNDVLGKLREAGYDPIQSLIELAKDENEDRKLRFYADRELVGRIAPLLKATEFKLDDELMDKFQKIKDEIDKIRNDQIKDA